MTGYQFIKFSESDRAARLTLARPPVNVLNIAMLREVNACLDHVADRTDLCALLIEAEGAVFSAGVDVPEHKQETVAEMMEAFHGAFRRLNALSMPVVAAAQGGAYGGGMELAIFCDILLAADDLKIGVPEITLGVFPPVAVAHLAHIVGINKAAELIFTGATIDAHEALRIGLANHVFPAAQFRDEVNRFLGRLTRLSAFSLRQTKQAFKRAMASDFTRALEKAEVVYLHELMAGSDPTEGLVAFIEKRNPVWKNL